MRDLRDLRWGDEVKDFIVNSLMKQGLRKEKIMVLLNKICIICPETSLYQFGYMDLILKTLFATKRIALERVRNRNEFKVIRNNVQMKALKRNF